MLVFPQSIFYMISFSGYYRSFIFREIYLRSVLPPKLSFCMEAVNLINFNGGVNVLLIQAT